MRKLRSIIGLTLVAAASLTCAAEDSTLALQLDWAEKQSQDGNFHVAVEQLRATYLAAKSAAEKSRAANALGVVYYRMRRYTEAKPLLNEGFESASDARDKARYANDLGNLFLGLNDANEAIRWYERSRDLAPEDTSLQLAAGLNLARLSAASDRLSQLDQLAKALPSISDEKELARYALNLGFQASELGPEGLQLAYESFEIARNVGAAIQDARLLAEALSNLSQLYERQDRAAEALRLADESAQHAQRAEARDLLVHIEWRRGRLYKRLGKSDLALSAYQRAVDHIEAIRQDIPVEYQNGKSSFRETLEPVYLGLADLLLVEADKKESTQQFGFYRRARDTLELMKQSELEDFLGDRCTVDSVKHAASSRIPARSAVLYPIILPDRLELLLETSQGIQRRSVPIADKEVRLTTTAFANRLRMLGDYDEQARKLYDWLLRPLEPLLEEAKIDTIVFVPDGVLRLVPIGALYDGKQFAVEKYAVATVPGLTMTNLELPARRKPQILLAGLSEPGPVIDKLESAFIDTLLSNSQPQTEALTSQSEIRGSRTPFRRRAVTPIVAGGDNRQSQIREALALPGVKKEIEALHENLKGEMLLNETFTLNRFKEQVTTGDYRVVHIASHGFFNSSAQSSFIMTYDDLLTIEGLQSLLRAKQLNDQPIDLLTLSACQTADGDDRAPLGLVGAALKARARSALGTLWSVSDEAATTLMPQFYQALSKPETTKIKALREAQLAMIKEPSSRHPFFWAPFILVGNWQ